MLRSFLVSVGLATLCALAPSASVAQNVAQQNSASFLVPIALGVSSVNELDGATICLQTESSVARLVEGYFVANGIFYSSVPFETLPDGISLYSNYACDVFAGAPAVTERVRQSMAAPNAHFVLPETLGQASPAQGAPSAGRPARPARP